MSTQHHPGIIYEPRAFWEVFNETSVSGVGGAASPSTSILSNDQHWYNGTKYPIEIVNLALSPIGYTSLNNGTTGTNFFGASNISRLKIGVFARFRRNFVRALPLAYSDQAANTAEPPRTFPVPGVSTTRFAAWSTVYQEYERPFSMPRDGMVEIQLSNPILGSAANPLNAPVWISFTEHTDPGFTSTAARTFQAQLELQTGTPVPYTFWDRATGASFGNFAGSALPFPASLLFDGHEFKSQSPARAGSTRMRGCSVMQDSLAFDTSASGSAVTHPMFLSQLTGSKMRVVDGGSGEFFWRDGAPLCLTFTTITPAIVYRFSEPFILGPGDQLQLEIEIPGSYYNGSTYETIPFTFGVAANGYAIIEG